MLKYVPEGTSRLLQGTLFDSDQVLYPANFSSARLTVQFQSVLERFTPHDTVFSFTAATELTESALSSACMLHTSIVSLNSSSSSLHRPRLGEITEDAEEGGGERPKSGLRQSILSDADSGFKEGRHNLASQATTNLNTNTDSHLPKGDSSSTPTTQISKVPSIAAFEKFQPENLGPTADAESPVEEAKGAKESTAELIPPRVEDLRTSQDSRCSTQSTRPSASELDRASVYTGYTPHKPKVKLGPRPSVQQPRTARARAEARPIANLPNSVRVSTRPLFSASRPTSSASHRPISQQSNRSAHSTFTIHRDSTPPPPLPQPSIHISALYQPPNSYLLNRPASPAPSATTSLAPSFNTIRPSGIAPEKQRLMRALQLRKKQQQEKACQTKPPSPAVSNEENSGAPEASLPQTDSKPNMMKKKSSLPSKLPPSQAPSPDSPMALSDLDAVPSGSGGDTAERTVSLNQTTTTSIGSRPLALPVDSEDEDVVSSIMDSESDTSEETTPRPKLNTISPSSSPALPTVMPHNNLSIGVLATSPVQSLEVPRPTESPAEKTRISEEQEEKRPYTIDPPLRLQSDSIDLATTTEKSSPQRAPSVKTEPSVFNTAEIGDYRSSQRPTRQHEAPDPHRTIVSPEASDCSDDESLYEELQSATVEEAKSMMVARSPINAVFNRRSPDSQRGQNGSISVLSRKTDESSNSTPEKAKAATGRSPSSALPQWPPTIETAQSLLIKKTNVSTGISKRIKALEMFSGRSDASGSSPISVAPPSPPPTAGLVKKRMYSHSPTETTIRGISTRTPPAKHLHYPSPAPTPTPASAAADNQPSWLQRTGSSTEILAPRRKGDSISVTARIIRDATEMKSKESSSPSKPVAMNLHRSPLVVEHGKAGPSPPREASKSLESSVAPSDSTILEPAPSETPRAERRRFSLSSSHSNSGKLPQSESFTKRLSMTIRHARTESGNLQTGNLPRSTSDASSVAEDKYVKDSRKNRLRKRMSVLTAGSRRSIASAFGSSVLRQEDPALISSQPPDSIAEHSREVSLVDTSIAESHAHVVDIGDVNIQFPDTLLWKRRFMRIDDQGFLILTPTTMEANRRGISRRFHLSDIKKPCLPALEREELPWSILLDFEDGSCLQCACESRYAQGQVLRSRLAAYFHSS